MSTESQLKQRISQLEDEVTSLKLKSEREELLADLKDLNNRHDKIGEALEHAKTTIKSIEKAFDAMFRDSFVKGNNETIKSLHDFLNYYTLMYNSLPSKICDVERKLEENNFKLQEIAESQEAQD